MALVHLFIDDPTNLSTDVQQFEEQVVVHYQA